MTPVELPSLHWRSHRPTADIQELVAVSYGVHPRVIIGRSRDQRHVWPRQVAMYLTREVTHRSLTQIGKAFLRDHTTVLHSLRVVERRMLSDPLDHADVLALREALEG